MWPTIRTCRAGVEKGVAWLGGRMESGEGEGEGKGEGEGEVQRSEYERTKERYKLTVKERDSDKASPRSKPS